ncbi:zinc finger protein OZF-like [Thalassophryne amazonica]|uniref:zinc finger protein OZF-like n=1 Tax=Thalassophryne amazonica TaxID=390379 RepID=UPI0014711C8C|nr:zinc finger protein OZF-like [Thalassophryne amazonica]
MSKGELLRALVKQRLAAAAEEIFVLFEGTMAAYEQELCRSKEENLRQRHLLDAVLNPHVRLDASDLQEMLAGKEKQHNQIPCLDQEAADCPQQDWSLCLDHKDSDPAYIKVEHEEVDVTEFHSPVITMKSETDEAETDNSHFWKETRQQASGLKITRTSKVSVSDMVCENDKKSFVSGSITHSNIKLELCHRAETLYSCSICAADFPSEENLELHMGLHQGAPQLDLRLCAQTLNQYEEFKEDLGHQNQTEDQRLQEAKWFDPDGQTEPPTDETSVISEPETDVDWEDIRDTQSGLTSVRYDNVSVSSKTCNTGEKPFMCSECDTRFVHKKSLQRHMRTHTEKKTCKCLTCHQIFYKEDLNEHMRSHKKEKPFNCPLCGTRFGHKKSLSRHIKAHSGEKLFSCSDCGKKFGRKSHLMRHAMIHMRHKIFH